MLKNMFILLFVSALSVACSKTVKGPAGKKFDVNVGGWSDMDKYREVRETAKKQEEPVEKTQECNVVDCPDSVRSGQAN